MQLVDLKFELEPKWLQGRPVDRSIARLVDRSVDDDHVRTKLQRNYSDTTTFGQNYNETIAKLHRPTSKIMRSAKPPGGPQVNYY